MLPRNHPDRIDVAFDDRRLVNNAGLILPATLALHLGLPELVDRRLDLGDAPGRANTGDKIMTLVASALAGGDIDDADVLRTGGTLAARLQSRRPPPWGRSCAASGGDVRQLDRGAASCWHGPGAGHSPSTGLHHLRDLWAATMATPATITRCWPWPLAPATDGPVREGRANTVAAPPTSCGRR